MFPAERIIALREEKRIAQKELARCIHVSPSSISEYEKGNIQPSVTVLAQLADFFEVSVDYLLGRTHIKIAIDKIEEKLVTRSGEVSIDTIFELNDQEKEAIGLLLNVLRRRKEVGPKG